jgi:hypothetical protein
MELDLQSLFGLLCTVVRYSLAEIPQLPPSPHIWAHVRGRYWSAKIDDISCNPLVLTDPQSLQEGGVGAGYKAQRRRGGRGSQAGAHPGGVGG